MLSLLSYAKFVSLRTPSGIAGSMWLSLDRQTFFLKGRPIELSRFRTMAQGIVVEAAQVLWEQLFWVGKKEEKQEENARLSAELGAIQDDVTIVRRGVSFLSPARLQELSMYNSNNLICPLPRLKTYAVSTTLLRLPSNMNATRPPLLWVPLHLAGS
jgi:hypothetical protein